MEKRASAGDQNERPRRYIKKKITGFDVEMVSVILPTGYMLDELQDLLKI